VNEATGLDSIAPDDCLGQMATIRLPAHVDVAQMKTRLFDEFRIEVPILTWNDQPFIRVSFAAYNTEADSDAVVAALKSILG
jgi:isopenicillin-N epimerase